MTEGSQLGHGAGPGLGLHPGFKFLWDVEEQNKISARETRSIGATVQADTSGDLKAW